MLSHDNNERLTRVGPGSPMGALMRRYWTPAAFSTQVAERDGPPVRVRLFGAGAGAGADAGDESAAEAEYYGRLFLGDAHGSPSPQRGRSIEMDDVAGAGAGAAEAEADGPFLERLREEMAEAAYYARLCEEAEAEAAAEAAADDI